MEEFLEIFEFVLLPFFTALHFAIITPPIGGLLSLRNETFLGITMPAVGTASIALALLLGVSIESTLMLYAMTGATIFLLMIFLPLGINKKSVDKRRREQILAALFCIGNTFMILAMGLSPDVDNHFKTVLQGEILAIMEVDFYTAAAVLSIFSIIGVRFRGFFYSYAIDEEFLFIQQTSYKRTVLLFRGAIACIITGGIILIGPLLTASFLILPAFFMESKAKSLSSFMIGLTLTGFLGTIIGFCGAVFWDIPPVPVIVCALIIITGIFRLLFYILKRYS